jgi:hypothetical protein
MEASYQKRRLQNLKRQARELGFELVGIEPDATVVFKNLFMISPKAT